MAFRGAPYPIVRHARGLLRTQDGIEQIKSDLLALLLTNPGERVMLPTFGTPLNSLIFEPNDSVISKAARDMVINSISTWEPRIAVQEIEVGVPPLDELSVFDEPNNQEHVLSIKIRFVDPENISQVEELKLEVPLAGG